jgi:4-hydroxybutyrate CoA-transferase
MNIIARLMRQASRARPGEEPAIDTSQRTPQAQRVEAARALLSGLTDRHRAVVISAMSPQQPDGLLAAIVEVARDTGVRLRILFADLSGSLAFLDAAARQDVIAGRLELVSLAGAVPADLSPYVSCYPNTLWDIDRQLSARHIRVDALVARVHRTEDPCSVSLGPMIGYTCTAIDAAAAVCLEIAPAFTGPQSLEVPLSRAHYHYADDTYQPADARPVKPATAQQLAIAGHVAGLIPDEATLQLGLGAVPEAVAAALAGKRDLGLHSGILPAALAQAIRAGTFTGAAKPAHRGRHVATGLMSACGPHGTPWPDSVLLLPLSQTHAPQILAAIANLWAVNSAFEIDLTGQVNAEYVNGVRIAGAGGQADFFRGAHASTQGRSVLALPARTTNGKPRIVPRLGPPGLSATPPAEVDYVVTEHGAADLQGRTARERALALIAIAHPDDRAALTRAL